MSVALQTPLAAERVASAGPIFSAGCVVLTEEATDYALVSPVDAREWSDYHKIRRHVLFEARGEFGVYDENRPDERTAGNHPKLLLHRGDAVGVVRIDVTGADAILRRVAIRSDVQRRGHGRVLLSLAERFARQEGCQRLSSHVAPDAVEFYRKCGFAIETERVTGGSGRESVFMTKRVSLAGTNDSRHLRGNASLLPPASGTPLSQAQRHWNMDQRFVSQRFPRSSAYHPEWITASVSGGANSLWVTEWVTETLGLRPGMRVLDLGCGRGASSVFLRREFDVQVWATDLWFSVSERFQRIRDAGVEDGVFPIHADARSLPFAAEFFDAIVAIDSFPYYGTDDLYLNYLARFVKPGGLVGVAGAGLVREIEGPVPEHLLTWWTADLWCLHSATWWRRHWERSGAMDIEVADTMPDGWQRWLDWQRAIAPNNLDEIQALEADRGRYLGYVRLIGRKRADARVQDPIVSVPVAYTKTPLLRVPK